MCISFKKLLLLIVAITAIYSVFNIKIKTVKYKVKCVEKVVTQSVHGDRIYINYKFFDQKGNIKTLRKDWDSKVYYQIGKSYYFEQLDFIFY